LGQIALAVHLGGSRGNFSQFPPGRVSVCAHLSLSAWPGLLSSVFAFWADCCPYYPQIGALVK